ncbi:MAG: hypothetical protein IT450_19750 [Phycisphaerales bacterium]|nr:hypothetical protein [Phycisphaerales bacterium]
MGIGSTEARPTHPIEHIPCPRCEYDLYRITEFPTVCPECGGTFTYDQLLAPWRLVRRDRACYLVSTLGLLAALLLAGATADRGGFCLLTGLIPFGGLCLGYAEPRKVWRWPTTMLVTLMIVGAVAEISSGDVGSGPPLALVAPTVLILPLVLSFVLANVGSTLCRTERMKLDEALARRNRGRIAKSREI